MLEDDPQTPIFDEFMVCASAESNTIKQGEPFEMNIFLPMIATNLPMQMTANGKPILVENGIGKVNIPTTTPGKFEWEGTVKLNIKGRDTTFTFRKEYTVNPN